MRVCPYCNTEQPDESFKYGARRCHSCEAERERDYRRTKRGLIKSIYKRQRHASSKRGHPQPSYTFDELYEWLSQDFIFNLLYDNWCNTVYEKDMIPSIDRMDDSKPYTFENIQVMTWAENDFKGRMSCRKSVVQLTLDGELVASYKTIKEASENTGVAKGNIVKTCKKEIGQSGGFQWLYESGYDAMKVYIYKVPGRPVMQLSKEGEYVALYETIKEASEKTNTNADNITKACKGQRKTAGGFKWMYKEDYEKLKATKSKPKGAFK